MTFFRPDEVGWWGRWGKCPTSSAPPCAPPWRAPHGAGLEVGHLQNSAPPQVPHLKAPYGAAPRGGAGGALFTPTGEWASAPPPVVGCGYIAAQPNNED